MKTSRMVATVAGLLLAGGPVLGQTHAPWPADWNNWNDPALRATVGNPGNAADTRYETPGYGAVGYTYNIGKFEVTAGQYTAFLNAVGGVDTYGLYNTDMARTDYGSGITRSGGGTVGNPNTYTVVADFTNRPVNYVSWGDTVRFANWLTNGQPTGAQGPLTTEDGAYHLAGAITDAALLAVVVPSASQRGTWSGGAKPYFLLTSEDEWYKAAYYKGGGTNAGYWEYPTRSDTPPGQDMTETTNPGNNANYYTGASPFPIDSGKFTTVAGEFQLSDSPYGTFDQGGNVWEWNEAILSGSYRGLRGGSFDGNVGHLHASSRYYGHPTGEWGFVGFRVSEVPEPATLCLLALGGLALVRRRHQ
jgi:formylglycine-generating enzyme required for sulfatase activity